MKTLTASLLFVPAFAFAAAALGGCASYRVVERNPAGGEVALEGSSGEAREKAEAYMSQQCAQGYDIVEEREAVVGQETHASASPGPRVFGMRTEFVNETTTDKREWRVRYQCRGFASPVAAGSPNQASVQEVVVRF
jgi:hypothetical protein